MGSGKDELKKRVAEQEKKLYRLEKMVLEQEEQLAKLRENMSSRIDVHRERVAEQDKKKHGLEKKVTRQAKKQKQEEQQERIFRLIQEVANQDFDENFLNLGLLGDSLKNPQDSDSDESFIRSYNCQTNLHNITSVGLGSGGLENDDGVSCYANSALQCLFSLGKTLINTLEELQGNVTEEVKRIAISSSEKTESARNLRSLLPAQYGFSEMEQQSLCEFWEVLLATIKEENSTNDPKGALNELFSYKVTRYLTCSVCQWSKLEETIDNWDVCYFPVPGVKNPSDRADEEILDLTDIPFRKVLSPCQSGEKCPKGHVCRFKTIFTHTPRFLAINLDRTSLSNKLNRRIVDYDPDDVWLSKTDESSVEYKSIL